MAVRVTPLALTRLTLLGLVHAWLIAAIVVDLVPDDADHFTEIAGTPMLATLEGGNVGGTNAIRSYDQILSRPIFFKSREPFIPPPPEATTSQAKATSAPVFVDPGLVLGGIMISRTNRQAYLFQKSKPDGSWIREGEDFLGWKLEFLDQGNARLQKDGHTIDLRLYPIRQ
jgi:hypothetical protein